MSPTVTLPASRRRSQEHEEALDALIAKVRQDHTIIAAILMGSMAYDDVWAKSDIDLVLISDEGRFANKGYCLVENDVNIHANVIRRSDFKKQIESEPGGGWGQSILQRSTLLFSTDESIRAYYDDAQHLGGRDRELRMLGAGSWVLTQLVKAEKWLYVKGDVDYSFLWIMRMVDSLATLEVFRHGEVPGREVAAQALRLNPPLFRAIYSDFIHRPKDAASVQEVLDLINAHLDEHRMAIFKPLLEYLREVGGIRSAGELDEHFQHARAEFLSPACEWLADKGVIRKVSTPLRLTVKSRVQVNEAAYYYDGGDEA